MIQDSKYAESETPSDELTGFEGAEEDTNVQDYLGPELMSNFMHFSTCKPK